MPDRPTDTEILEALRQAVRELDAAQIKLAAFAPGIEGAQPSIWRDRAEDVADRLEGFAAPATE